MEFAMRLKRMTSKSIAKEIVFIELKIGKKYAK